MKKISLCAFFVLSIFALPAFSTESKLNENEWKINKINKINIEQFGIFNERLGESDKKTLEEGGIILRSVSSMKKLCVKSKLTAKKNEKLNGSSDMISNLVVMPMSKKVKSGYIAEIINFRPYEGNEDLIERINEAMSDFLSYTDIPYYSEQTKKTYPLYKYAEVTDTLIEGNTMTIKEILEMDMFGRFHSEITVENHDDYFLYKLKNTDKLKYKGFITVVSPEEMCSIVAVFRIGNNWMIYAVGGANILRIPFVNARAEPAFTGRVKAFADFVFKKIDNTGKNVETSVDKKDASQT